MYLQIGDDLRTIHNDQMVYLNRHDIALTLSPDSRYGWFITFKCWKTTQILELLQLCYCIMHTYYLIWWKCVTNKNKIKICSRGIGDLKKTCVLCQKSLLINYILLSSVVDVLIFFVVFRESDLKVWTKSKIPTFVTSFFNASESTRKKGKQQIWRSIFHNQK